MYNIMHIEDIETPALVIDLDKLDRNIYKMSDYIKSAGCNLRPHFKTHKCTTIAHKQIKAGAIGITCAKLSEAEILAKSGIDNILIANQIVQPSKITRLAGISKLCNVIIAVDSLENVDDICHIMQQVSSRIGILIEVDVGMGRCGVRSKEEALRLAEKVSKSPRLEFKGIMGYEGHCVFIEDADERRRSTQEANEILVSYKSFLKAKGYKVEIVSCGGTGTYEFASMHPEISEIQAGSYIFMDTKYRKIKGVDFENSIFLVSTVISKPEEALVVIDAGLKSMTNEFGIPQIVYPDGGAIVNISEEHSILDISFSSTKLDIGDKVIIYPSHVCTTVNLHDRYYLANNDIVVSEWDIAGRGKFI